MAFSLSDMVQFGTNLGQLLNTHPLLLKLGRWRSLSLQRTTYEDVAMLEYDESYLRAAREAGAMYFKCGDWRCALGRCSNGGGIERAPAAVPTQRFWCFSAQMICQGKLPLSRHCAGSNSRSEGGASEAG